MQTEFFLSLLWVLLAKHLFSNAALLLQFSLNQVYLHSGAQPHSGPALVSSITCFEPNVVDSHF